MTKDDLNITVYKGMRDNIYKTPLQKEYGMIPPGLCTLIGQTGSGKSNVIANIINKKSMLGDYFDEIYLFCLSPSDTILANCNIKKENIFMDDDPAKLVKILNNQDEKIKNDGFEEADHVLVILDDIVQSKSFLKHPILNKIAFSGSWSKVSCMITSQSYCEIPRRIRLNIHSILLFHGLTNTELERFCLEHQSPYLTKEKFNNVIKYCLAEPFSFLFYNRTNPDKKKAYRKGFKEILRIK